MANPNILNVHNPYGQNLYMVVQDEAWQDGPENAPSIVGFPSSAVEFYTVDTYQEGGSIGIKDYTEKQIAKQCLPNQFFLIDYLYAIDYEPLLNEICTFMLAGQDSVGAAVSFTLYNLAKHPDVQQNVVEELERVFNEHSDINMDCLNDMVYLEQCIKESLRLFPSVPLFAKKLVEDVQLDNHILPAGLNIFIAPIATHRLEEYYPNPEKFDPDRFSIENQGELNPYAFIPFSAGPRNCIGYKFAYLEMKTIIASILRHYVISVPPSYKLELMYRVTLRAKGGIRLHLKPR